MAPTACHTRLVMAHTMSARHLYTSASAALLSRIYQVHRFLKMATPINIIDKTLNRSRFGERYWNKIHLYYIFRSSLNLFYSNRVIDSGIEGIWTSSTRYLGLTVGVKKNVHIFKDGWESSNCHLFQLILCWTPREGGISSQDPPPLPFEGFKRRHFFILLLLLLFLTWR